MQQQLETIFSNEIREFVRNMGLVSVWDKFPVTHTHIHTDLSSLSTLDHFLMNPALLEAVEQAEAIHLGDNLSRHSPIIIKVKIETLPAPVRTDKSKFRKPAWNKANEDQHSQFTRTVAEKVDKLVRPHSFDCMDPECKDQLHSEDRDGLLLDLLGCVIESSHEILPMVGGGSGSKKDKKHVPGWKEVVEPKRNDAIFWHSIWISAGRPNKGVLRDVMANTRNKYHYTIRQVKKEEDNIRAAKLLEASKTGSLNLLAEMKKIKGCKKDKSKLPDIVAGKSGEQSIAEEFRKVYFELYNMCDDSMGLADLKNLLDSDISNNKEDMIQEVKKVTGKVLKQAANRIKPGKGDVTGSYNSDMVKNCPDNFYDVLAGVFRSRHSDTQLVSLCVSPIGEGIERPKSH